MRIDWSTAKISAGAGNDRQLRVNIVDVPHGTEYEIAFSREIARWRAADADPRRVDRDRTGGGVWGIIVTPISDDVDAERRQLDDFVDRIVTDAAPKQAKQDEEDRRKRELADKSAAEAEELTRRFREPRGDDG